LHEKESDANDNDSFVEEGSDASVCSSKTADDALREEIFRMQLYDDPDCCNNLSRSLRVVPGIWDVQVESNYDGYLYCFTSVADGPMLSQMALKQILVLLHVIHSFIPEECVLETEYLKPTFDKQGGLEKLQKKVQLTEEEARQAEEVRQKISSLPISEMPFDTAYVVGE
jgi:hypothetical protein